jgi:hypothetical protein
MAWNSACSNSSKCNSDGRETEPSDIFAYLIASVKALRAVALAEEMAVVCRRNAFAGLGFAALLLCAVGRTAVAQSVHDTPPSPAARVIAWITSTEDNAALPFMVIDKQAATMFVFDAKGRRVGIVPVLIGVATGDESSPGVGTKELAKIGPAERNTPAGRFLAKYGLAAGGERVLWVDYANAVALHAVITADKKERRLARLKSKTAEDNRITFGCINVPTAFYQKRIRPLFRKAGGYVYILPDTKPLEAVFPSLLVQPFLARNGEAQSASPLRP